MIIGKQNSEEVKVEFGGTNLNKNPDEDRLVTVSDDSNNVDYLDTHRDKLNSIHKFYEDANEEEDMSAIGGQMDSSFEVSAQELIDNKLFKREEYGGDLMSHRQHNKSRVELADQEY